MVKDDILFSSLGAFGMFSKLSLRDKNEEDFEESSSSESPDIDAKL